MRWRTCLWALLGGLAYLSALSAFQNFNKPWFEYPGESNGRCDTPDYRDRTEFVFARLMYPSYAGGYGFGGRGFRRGGGYDWRQGGSSWTTDYPCMDRHFMMAIRRLSKISARAVEQVINVEDGDQYDWPWMYAVEVGHWDPNDAMVKGLREYLLRGGFLMVDDFHGNFEWQVFEAGMKRIFPDRPIVDLPKDDQIFHVVYNLDDKYQVPGAQFLRSGRICEQCENGGSVEHWRGIYDDKGRVMVAICHNMDLGDALEHADNPYYPAKYSELAIHIGINYITYALTH